MKSRREIADGPTGDDVLRDQTQDPRWRLGVLAVQVLVPEIEP
jgi:hypothetical protein